MPDFDPQTKLSNSVELEVRKLIGELNMQVIVLKSMLEMAQQQPGQPQQPQPQQPPAPQPTPEPEKPPSAARQNGGVRPIREVGP